MSVLIHNARIMTLAAGAIPRRGDAANELAVIERGYIRCAPESEDSKAPGAPGAQASASPAGVITHLGEGDPPAALTKDDGIDAMGRVVMPAFVDAHTHACWAAERLDEWDRKRAGASYLDILSEGGGIMSTVRAVRRADEETLIRNLDARLDVMHREGAGAVEVKSGYGLSAEHELKMVRAIAHAAECARGFVTPTALLGHAIDPEQSNFVDRTIEETLPAIHEAFPRITIDAYCEEGAWSVDECLRLFDRAASLGHPFRIHADQFNSFGMTPLAAERGARSVDHLEASSDADLRALAASETFGVMLPACGFHLDGRYADGRRFMDLGGALVIASNCNPGSAPTSSMPFIVALAVRRLGLTVAEAITACTVNAAALLGRIRSGVLAPGMAADIILLRHRDERMLAFEVGGDPVDGVILNGAIVHRRPPRGGGV